MDLRLSTTSGRQLQSEAPLELVYVVAEMDGSTMNVIGEFASRELADAACVTPAHFIGVKSPGVKNPTDPAAWPGIVYPRAEATQ